MKNQDEKLTLKLKRSAIAKAKKIAKVKGTSLSRMVEGYFLNIAEPRVEFEEEELSPRLKALSGILKEFRHLDPKKEYERHLERKYGR